MKPEHYTKDTIVVTILRPTHIPLPDTLEEMVEFIGSGDGIGSFTVSASTDVPPHQVRAALLSAGNDGSFFEEC